MNKHHFLKKAAIAILLLLSMLLTACSGVMTTTEQLSTASESTPAESNTGEEFSLQKQDYEGQDFNILLWSFTQLMAEEENGDLINDAVFYRNRQVQEEYNINFKYVQPGLNSSSDQYNKWVNMLDSSVMANDNSYQLAGGFSYRLALHSMNGNYHNLNAIDSIDFTQAWWPKNLLKAGSIGNKMYLAKGHVEPSYYDMTSVIFFNKNIADNLEIPNLYSLVKDKKWTIDRQIEYSAAASADIDGNGEFNDKDRYGFLAFRTTAVDSYVTSLNVPITGTDSNGIPYLLGLTEQYVNIHSKVYEYIVNSGHVFFNSGKEIDMFKNSQGLFYGVEILDVHRLRDMEDDFGMLPYPMWDENQDDYITYNTVYDSTGFIIPITADAEMGGTILEALAYYGYKDVLPEYYERALQVKAVRDSESAAMLDIIFNNIEFDFTQFYSFCFGDQKAPPMLLRMSVRNKKPSISSMWAADEELYKATMESLISSLQ